MADNGITLDNITLQRGDTRFLFDLTIPQGALTIATGPSGAGKSTLLDLIAGFTQANNGHILISGKDVTNDPPAKRPVSMLFQENNLFGHLSLFDNVALGISPDLRLSDTDRQNVRAALERVELCGRETAVPQELSGGERQRAALARALVRHHPVLLLDEPLAALGPAMRQRMAGLINQLRREYGLTVILVTHDPVQLLGIATHILFILAGGVHAFGTPDQILGHTQSPEITLYLHAEHETMNQTTLKGKKFARQET